MIHTAISYTVIILDSLQIKHKGSDCVIQEYEVEFEELVLNGKVYNRLCLKSEYELFLEPISISGGSFSSCTEKAAEMGKLPFIFLIFGKFHLIKRV